MTRLTRLALLLLPILAAVPLSHPVQAAPSARPLATWHLRVLHDGRTTLNRWFVVKKATHRPFGHWIQRTPLRHGERIVEYPILARPARSVQTAFVQTPTGSYTVPMLITYYVDVGPMADGVETYWGAAACGFDLSLLTRVAVPGVGLLTCHDREGYQPFRHIDVWGFHPGLGADWRPVTVYS